MAEITKMRNSIERILLVRMSALGDCVCALPVFSALREGFPKAHIAWAIQDHFAALIHNLPGLDELIVFPRRRWKDTPFPTLLREGNRLWRHLRMRKFDVVIDVQSNTKSGIISWMSGAPLRIGHGKGEAKELSACFNNRKIVHPAERKHVIQRNLALVGELGIQATNPVFPLPADPFAKAYVNRWLQEAGLGVGQFVLLSAFTGRPEKDWPLSNYRFVAEILAEQGIPCVFLRCPGKEQEIQKSIPFHGNPSLHFAPATSLLEMVELIRSARLCFGGDTGPQQIAGGLGIPSLTLFGPTCSDRYLPWTQSASLPLESDPGTVANAIRIQIG